LDNLPHDKKNRVEETSIAATSWKFSAVERANRTLEMLIPTC
jgi:hypothetical protein